MLLALAMPGQKPPEPQDRESYFRNIVVQRGETVDDVACIFCSVTIRGTVKGDVGAVWGNVVVEGTVEGDVGAVGGNLRATAGSRINGDAAAVGGRITREGDAKIGGEVSEVTSVYLPGQRQLVFPGVLYFLAFNLALALIPLALLRARRVQNLSEACRAHPMWAFLLGAILLAALIYLVSATEKFGRFEDVADWVFLGVLLVLLMPGFAGVSFAFGRILMRGVNIWAGVLLGSFFLSLLGLVPLAGLVILLIVWVFALGATSLSRFGFSPVNASPATASTDS